MAAGPPCGSSPAPPAPPPAGLGIPRRVTQIRLSTRPGCGRLLGGSVGEGAVTVPPARCAGTAECCRNRRRRTTGGSAPLLTIQTPFRLRLEVASSRQRYREPARLLHHTRQGIIRLPPR